jgi:hypothetical protein
MRPPSILDKSVLISPQSEERTEIQMKVFPRRATLLLSAATAIACLGFALAALANGGGSAPPHRTLLLRIHAARAEREQALAYCEKCLHARSPHPTAAAREAARLNLA